MHLPLIFLFVFGFISGPWEPMPGPEGGPVYDIAPVNNGVYLAARGGGPYEWSGDSWTFLGENLPNQVAECIEVRDEYLYVGLYQESLMISEDGGMTWRNSGSPVDIVDVAVDPVDPRNIYVGSYDLKTVYGSSDGGYSWHSLLYSTGAPVACIEIAPSNRNYIYVGTENNYSSGGLFSSTDRGETWNKIDCSAMENSAMAVVIDSSDPAHLLAGSHFWGVFETTDRGVTWIERNSGLTYRNIRSLAGDDDLNLIFAGTSLGGLYRSEDGGKNWIPVHQGLPDGMTVWSVEKDVTVDDRWWLGSNVGCFVSNDDGLTWHELNTGMHGEFVLDFAWGNGIRYVGTEAGVFHSIDDGFSWKKDESGLPADDMMIPYIAASKVSNDIVFAANSTKVFRSLDGGVTWQNRSFGISLFTVVYDLVSSASNPDRLYAATLHTMLLGGGVYRTDNGGGVWRKKNSGLGIIDFVPLNIVVSEQDDEQVYVLIFLRGIYKSTNGGDDWNLAVRGIDDILNLNCLAISASDPEILFAGTASGKIYRTTDGALTWQQLEGVPVGLVIYSITVHPDNPNRLSVVTDSGIITSLDSGNHWSPDNDGLENGIIPNTLSFSPTSIGDLCLGTAGCSIYRKQSNQRKKVSLR